MNKIFVGLTALMLCCGITGCSSSETSTQEAKENTKEESKETSNEWDNIEAITYA